MAYHFVKRNGSICESSCSENETDGVKADRGRLLVNSATVKPIGATHAVEVLRFLDAGVLNGAADGRLCSCFRMFLEKYLRSTWNTLLRTYRAELGKAPVGAQCPNEGNNRENMVIRFQ